MRYASGNQCITIYFDPLPWILSCMPQRRSTRLLTAFSFQAVASSARSQPHAAWTQRSCICSRTSPEGRPCPASINDVSATTRPPTTSTPAAARAPLTAGTALVSAVTGECASLSAPYRHFILPHSRGLAVRTRLRVAVVVDSHGWHPAPQGRATVAAGRRSAS